MSKSNNVMPVAIGAAVGAVVVTIIGFTSGWAVTAQRMDIELQKANISVQAEVCAAKAELFLKETNNTDDLQGYQTAAREKREELARAHTTELADDAASTSTVINACAGLLNRART